MVKSLLVFFVEKLKIHRLIQLAEEKDRFDKCNNSVINNGGFFLRESHVNNMLNNRSNIIIGNETRIRGELITFKYGGKIIVGEWCYIGEGTKIWSGEHISIGNNVLISHNVNIIDTSSHEIDCVERADGYKNLLINGHSLTKGSLQTAPITIEDDVWINFNVTILRGVTIGKGAIIAAGAVVTKDIPPFVLAGGNPCNIIRKLN